MKTLLLILLAFVAVILYALFRLWLFFRRMVRPAHRDSRRQNSANEHQTPNSTDTEVLYSNDKVVVLKGEAKGKDQ